MVGLIRMGPLTRTNTPWLDAFPPKGSTSRCSSRPGEMIPKNGPYFTRSGNCTVAIGFSNAVTIAWSTVRSAVASILERCLEAPLAERVGGMSTISAKRNKRSTQQLFQTCNYFLFSFPKFIPFAWISSTFAYSFYEFFFSNRLDFNILYY